MTIFTQLHKLCHIYLGVSYEVIWRDSGTVKESQLHPLSVLYTVVQGLPPDRAHCLLLCRGLAEIEVVKVHHTVRVHYGENFAARQGYWLQTGGLNDVNHHITCKPILCRHLADR